MPNLDGLQWLVFLGTCVGLSLLLIAFGRWLPAPAPLLPVTAPRPLNVAKPPLQPAPRSRFHSKMEALLGPLPKEVER